MSLTPNRTERKLWEFAVMQNAGGLSRRSFFSAASATVAAGWSERELAPDCEPPLGAHMVTPRLGYTHHGIYAGQGRIVQYAGLSRGLRRGPVEEVSLAQFCQGHPLRIRVEESYWHDRTAVVHRARLRLGENRYHLLKNNCEHFCEWCVHGEHRSYQVEELIGRCTLVWHHVIETAGRALLRRGQISMGPQPRRIHNVYQ